MGTCRTKCATKLKGSLSGVPKFSGRVTSAAAAAVGPTSSSKLKPETRHRNVTDVSKLECLSPHQCKLDICGSLRQLSSYIGV